MIRKKVLYSYTILYYELYPWLALLWIYKALKRKKTKMSLTEMNHLLSLKSSFWLVKNDRVSLFIGCCWYLQGPVSKITWKSKSAGRQIGINYNQPLSQGMGKVEVYLAFNIQTWQSITGLIIPIIIRIPIFIIWINFIKSHFATFLIDTSVSALQARVDKGSKNQIYITFCNHKQVRRSRVFTKEKHI